INLKRSSIYGLGVLLVSIQYRLAKWGVSKFGIFELKD
ncbi:MAG: glycosyltransferase family 2 protein, partial [Bacteroidia bacterium]